MTISAHTQRREREFIVRRSPAFYHIVLLHYGTPILVGHAKDYAPLLTRGLTYLWAGGPRNATRSR
jgi:hypothetical protein